MCLSCCGKRQQARWHELKGFAAWNVYAKMFSVIEAWGADSLNIQKRPRKCNKSTSELVIGSASLSEPLMMVIRSDGTEARNEHTKPSAYERWAFFCARRFFHVLCIASFLPLASCRRWMAFTSIIVILPHHLMSKQYFLHLLFRHLLDFFLLFLLIRLRW